MSKLGRNEPCSCGSGKKYKQCCLIQQRQRRGDRKDRQRAVEAALAWLGHEHRNAVNRWVKHVWHRDLIDEEKAVILRLDAHFAAVHDTNLLELLMAEGQFDAEFSSDKPLDLVLAYQGLQLDAQQRQFLRQFADHPLRLYRVQSVRQGEGFALQDALDAAAAEIQIDDIDGSRMLDDGDVLGLRLLPVDGSWEASGSVYHIPVDAVDETLQQLASVDAADFSLALARHWLKLLIEDRRYAQS